MSAKVQPLRTLTTSSVSRLRNVVVVLFAVGLGVVVPHAAATVEALTLLIVTFLLYGSFRGTNTTPADAPRFLLPVAAVLAITYVAVPIAGISWARYLLSGDPLVGIAVMLSVPATAGSAIVWTRSSHGNAELCGLASASTIVLAPLLTPYVLTQLVGEPIDLPIARLEFELLVILVASLVLVWAVPKRLLGERPIERGSEVSILLLVYAGVGTADLSGASATLVFEVGLVAVAVLVVGFVAAVIATAVLQLERADLLAVFFSGTLKNLGIAVLIVLSLASDEVFLTVIVFYVCQQLLSAVFVDGQRVGRGGS